MAVVERVERARDRARSSRGVLLRGRGCGGRSSPPYCRTASTSPAAQPSPGSIGAVGSRAPRPRRAAAPSSVAPTVEGVGRVEQGEVEAPRRRHEREGVGARPPWRGRPRPVASRLARIASRARSVVVDERRRGPRPRDSASMPSAPEPANRSSTVAPSTAPSAAERVEHRLPHPVGRRPGVVARRRDQPAAPADPGHDAHARRDRNVPVPMAASSSVTCDRARSTNRHARNAVQLRDAARPARRVPRLRRGRRREGRGAHRRRDRVLRRRRTCATCPAAPVRAARADATAAVEAGDRRDRGLVRRRRRRAGGVVRPRVAERPPGSAASSAVGRAADRRRRPTELPRIVGLGRALDLILTGASSAATRRSASAS